MVFTDHGDQEIDVKIVEEFSLSCFLYLREGSCQSRCE